MFFILIIWFLYLFLLFYIEILHLILLSELLSLWFIKVSLCWLILEKIKLFSLFLFDAFYISLLNEILLSFAQLILSQFISLFIEALSFCS